MIDLPKDQRDFVVEELLRFVSDELGQEIGRFQAMDLYDFFSEKLGAYFYNRGLFDAQVILSKSMDNILEVIADIEKPTEFGRYGYRNLPIGGVCRSREVTANGGFPILSADGQYIYYVRDRRGIFRVGVTTDPVFRIRSEEELICSSSGGHSHFDLLPDGKSVVSYTESAGTTAKEDVRIILNFDREMERLAPRTN